MKRILPVASNYDDKDLYLAKALGLVNTSITQSLTPFFLYFMA